MILQALNDCYKNLLADPNTGIAPLHYNSVPVSYAFELALNGELLAVYPLYEIDGKGKIARRLIVPEQVVRTSGIVANFMCDHSGYVLGTDNKNNPQRAILMLEAFLSLHTDLLGGLDDVGAKALLAFLGTRLAGDISDAALHNYQDELLEGGNIVFRISGEKGYLHERPAIKQVWELYKANTQSETVAQCLVTGDYLSVARVHPPVKRVAGTPSRGAAVVSFNDSAYESYRKTQSYNAPVSEKVAVAYTTALNYLLENKKYNTLIGDATVVFWATGKSNIEEELLARIWGASDKDGEGANQEATQCLHDALRRMQGGQDIRALGLDPNVRIHILGLAANVARISIRFYQTKLFGTLLERFAQHYTDMQIVQSKQYRDDFPPVWRILAETAAQGKRDNIPSTLVGSTMNAILKGTPYPQNLYQAILLRIRADKQINATRAGIIKAYLIRQARARNQEEGVYSVALETGNKQQAYLLGRLFAQLERAQLNAQGAGINKTIRDTYFSAASATPAVIFPRLLRLTQHHLAGNRDKNERVDRDIGKILGQLALAGDGVGFPASLSLQDQGLFILGYYHQRQDFYTPQSEKVEVGEMLHVHS